MIYLQILLICFLIIFPAQVVPISISIFILNIYQLFNQHSKRAEINKAIQQLTDFENGHFGKRLFNTVAELTELTKAINKILELYQEDEQKVRIRQRNMQERLSHISHDLRTPLTSLLGYIDALRDNIYTTDSERQIALTTLYEKANRIKSYTENFFHLSQLDNPDKEFELIPNDIVEMLRESIIEMMPLIESNQFELSIDIPNHPIKIPIHRHSIKRLFINLIDNVLKYASDHKYLKIDLEEESECIKIKFSDKGSGISDEIWQLVKHKQKMTSGFGLLIIQKIINLHHGEFERSQDSGLHQLILTIPKQKM